MSAMPLKNSTPLPDPPRDLGTDYALIAVGIAATTLAAVYLFLT